MIPEVFSDHLSIVAVIRVSEVDSLATSVIPLQPKLRRSPRNRVTYQERVNVLLNDHFGWNTNLNDDLNRLTKIIYDCCPASKYYGNRNNCFSGRQKWFDLKCQSERREVFGLLKFYKELIL